MAAMAAMEGYGQTNIVPLQQEDHRSNSAQASSSCLTHFGTEAYEVLDAVPEAPKTLALEDGEPHYGTRVPIGYRPPIKARPKAILVPKTEPKVLGPAMDSPKERLPAKPWLRLSGRGEKAQNKDLELRPPNSFNSMVKTSCPNGCKLELLTTGQDEFSATVQVRYHNGHPTKFDLQGCTPTHRSCPGCNRHIMMRVIERPRYDDDESDEDEEETEDQPKHAFMACLWASNGEDWRDSLRKYVHDALILGYCLARYCSLKRRVLLVTRDAAQVPEVQFLDQFW